MDSKSQNSSLGEVKTMNTKVCFFINGNDHNEHNTNQHNAQVEIDLGTKAVNTISVTERVSSNLTPTGGHSASAQSDNVGMETIASSHGDPAGTKLDDVEMGIGAPTYSDLAASIPDNTEMETDDGLTDIDHDLLGDGTSDKGVDKNEAEEEPASGDEVIDSQCKAIANCRAQSKDYRKVVSHFFGRNKKCTQNLPKDAWIVWCRKHYQRYKYRAEEDGNWHLRQLEQIRDQLDVFEKDSDVSSWDIILNKKAQTAIAEENARIAANTIANAPNTSLASTATTEAQSPSDAASDIADDTNAAHPTPDTSDSLNDSDSDKTAAASLIKLKRGTPSATVKDGILNVKFTKPDNHANASSNATTQLLPAASASNVSDAILSRATSDPEEKTADPIIIPNTVAAKEKQLEAVNDVLSPDNPVTTHPAQPKDTACEPSNPPPSPKLKSEPLTPPPASTLALAAPSLVWERFLVPYLGDGKSYTDVRNVLDVIENEFYTHAFQALEHKDRQFPGVEFLPEWEGKKGKKVGGRKRKIGEVEEEGKGGKGGRGREMGGSSGGGVRELVMGRRLEGED
ncbi:hypothetical protein ACLMJK_000569 [Lecanora helva]